MFTDIVKIALLIAIASGQNPFAYLNMETPNIYSWALENKVRLEFKS